jgi:hypothetical protein
VDFASRLLEKEQGSRHLELAVIGMTGYGKHRHGSLLVLGPSVPEPAGNVNVAQSIGEAAGGISISPQKR